MTNTTVINEETDKEAIFKEAEQRFGSRATAIAERFCNTARFKAGSTPRYLHGHGRFAKADTNVQHAAEYPFEMWMKVDSAGNQKILCYRSTLLAYTKETGRTNFLPSNLTPEERKFLRRDCSAATTAKNTEPPREHGRYYNRAPVAQALNSCSTRAVAEPVRARTLHASTRVKRNPLTAAEKQRKLESQNHNCIYCGRQFGSVVFDRANEAITLQLRWEHFEPFALRQNNCSGNLFAACHVCNDFKSDLLFDSLADARQFLARRWEQEAYQDTFPGLAPFRANLALCGVN